MEFVNFKNELKLSRLGMGAMRFPTTDGLPMGPIDYEKAQEMIDYCMEKGINYYDTAYIYHGGDSEVFLGKALAKYPRESFYLADKYHIKAAQPDYKLQFEEQLKRLNVDYIDFYLIHSIADDTIDQYLTNGCIPYFLEQKKQGRIKYLGFSFHGTQPAFKRVVQHHEWDFALIQLNYYDWLYGPAKDQYDLLTEKNIPVMVMEPVHGGMLTNLTEAGNELLKSIEPQDTIPSWAFRFVMNLENVFVVLSGMSNMEQIKENIQTVTANKPLTAADWETLQKACQHFHEATAVTCTSCKYCLEDCPVDLNLPMLLATYNEYKQGGNWRLSRFNAFAENEKPQACIDCGICIGHCPQNIQIPSLLREMAEAYEKL